MADNDISKLLNDWPFEPGIVNARHATGEDGRPLIQVRIQLGILQFEAEGRPDGLHPHDCESECAWQTERLRAYEEQSGQTAGFVLSSTECRALRDEAALYHHRALALFVLEDYLAVVRDTTHNLAIFNLCRDYAQLDGDRTAAEHLRPPTLTMRVRAMAADAIRTGDARTALGVIDTGLQDVMQALGELGFGDRVEDSNDVQLLRGMRDALVPKLPGSQRAELERRLRAALAAENYELASILRDELRLL